MKANIAPDRMPGQISGSVISAKVRKGPARRLWLASSSTGSTARRLALTDRMTKGMPRMQWASARPRKSGIPPISLKKSSSASPNTIAGKISGARNSVCSAVANHPFRRATNKAAITPRTVLSSDETVAIWMLRKNASRRLSVLKKATNQRTERPGAETRKNPSAKGGDQHDHDRPQHQQISDAREHEQNYVRHLSRAPARDGAQDREDQERHAQRQNQQGEGDRGGERPAERANGVKGEADQQFHRGPPNSVIVT